MNGNRNRYSFYDLDESWYRYMMADKKERVQMCKETLEMEDLVLGVCAVLFVVGGIWAVVKGWI